VKCVGLILIFIYTFFKFAWAYRLFQLRRDPVRRDAARERVRHARSGGACHPHHAPVRSRRPALSTAASVRSSSRFGYLGWFVSPWVLFLTTAAVVIVTWRRQFASNAWQAMES